MSSQDVMQPKSPRICTFSRTKVALLASRALEPSEAIRVQRHVDRCALCRAELQAYQELDIDIKQRIRREMTATRLFTVDDIARAEGEDLREPPLSVEMSERDAFATYGDVMIAGETLPDNTLEMESTSRDRTSSEFRTLGDDALLLVSGAPCLGDAILTRSLRLADDPRWIEEPNYSPRIAHRLRLLYAEPVTDLTFWDCAHDSAFAGPGADAVMSDSQCLRAHYVQGRAFMVQHQYTLARCHLDLALNLSLELRDFLASAECAYFVAAIEYELGSAISAIAHLEFAAESLWALPVRQREGDASFELEVRARLVIEELGYAPEETICAPNQLCTDAETFIQF